MNAVRLIAAAANDRPSDASPPGTRISTPAEREDRLRSLHERLARQVRDLRTGEDWTKWLTVASRFHNYSFNNTLLILGQRPDATAVAGYRAWQEMGRQVRKNERGIQILAPILKRKDDETGSEQKSNAAKLVGYRVTHVWDVSQSDGVPIPIQPMPVLLRGEAPTGLWEDLAAMVAEQGFTLDRGDCGGANGLTNFRERTVRIRGDVDDSQAVKSLAHEMGHIALMHDPAAMNGGGCRGIAEVEAESVAYLVAASHGLVTNDYTFPYVTGWASEVSGKSPEDVVVSTGQRVLRAAHDIIERTLTVPAQHDASKALVSDAARAQEGLGASSRLRMAADLAAPSRSAPSPDELLAMNVSAARYFQEHVMSSWVPNYLKDRGLAAAIESSWPWRVGHAPPSWTGVTDRLRQVGHSDSAIEASGLALRASNGRLIDRFRDRLMMPVRDAEGLIVGFIGRAAPGADERTLRYLNSPESELYRKGDHLFGLAEARAALLGGAAPVLVEGPLDAIAVTTGTSGRFVGLAPCGTALTAHQAQALVVASAAAPLVVATDGDEAGRAAASRAYALIGPGRLKARAADMPPGMDPAALLAQGGNALELAMGERSRPLVDAAVDHCFTPWLERLQWVEGRVGAVRSAALLVAELPADEASRQIQRIAEATGVSVPVVIAEVASRSIRRTELNDAAAGGLGPPVTLPRTGPTQAPAAALSTGSRNGPAIHRSARR